MVPSCADLSVAMMNSIHLVGRWHKTPDARSGITGCHFVWSHAADEDAVNVRTNYHFVLYVSDKSCECWASDHGI